MSQLVDIHSLLVQDCSDTGEGTEYILPERLTRAIGKSVQKAFDECYKDETFAEKVFNKSHNLIVGVIYRPPDTDIRKFNDLLLVVRERHVCKRYFRR